MNAAAYMLRENTGSSGVVQAALTAAAKLADHEIPHLVVGGLAVQEHGYPRVTIDLTELILRRNLPRDFNVAPPVRSLHVELWDALNAEA